MASPPQRTDGHVAFVMKNLLGYRALIFLRGNPNLVLYKDAACTVSLVDDSTEPRSQHPKEYDCSNYTGDAFVEDWYNCQPSSVNRTFVFDMEDKSVMTVHLKEGDSFESGITWSAPWDVVFYNSMGNRDPTNTNLDLRDIALGPLKQSVAEFTVTNSTHVDYDNRIAYDASYVNGVTCGFRLSYRDSKIDADVQTPPTKELCRKAFAYIANEKKDDKIKDVVTPLAEPYPTILSNQYTENEEVPSDVAAAGYGYTNTELAQCPSYLALVPSRQHLCRVWYFDQYAESAVDSFCKWLRDQKSQAYCWAMDEWICKNSDCGKDPEGKYAPKYEASDTATIEMDRVFKNVSAGTFVEIQLVGMVTPSVFSIMEEAVETIINNYINQSNARAVENSTVFYTWASALENGGTAVRNGAAFADIPASANSQFEVGRDLAIGTSEWNTKYGSAINTASGVNNEATITIFTNIAENYAYVAFAGPVSDANKSNVETNIRNVFGGPYNDFTQYRFSWSDAVNGNSILHVIPETPSDTCTLVASFGSDVLEYIRVDVLGSTANVPLLKDYLDKRMGVTAPTYTFITIERTQYKQENYVITFNRQIKLEEMFIIEAAINISVNTNYHGARFWFEWGRGEGGGGGGDISTLNVVPYDHILYGLLTSARDTSSILRVAITNAIITGSTPNPPAPTTTPYTIVNSYEFHGDGLSEENNYSCGKVSNTLIKPDFVGFWWPNPNQIGAVDNTIRIGGQDRRVNVEVDRMSDGTMTIEYLELPWLSQIKTIDDCGNLHPEPHPPSPPSPPSPPPDNDDPNHNYNKLYIIISISVGIALFILTIVAVAITVVIIKNRAIITTS